MKTKQQDEASYCPNKSGNSQNGEYSNSPKLSRMASLAQIGEDWLYLALLGTSTALISFAMDSMITLFLNARLWLYNDLGEDIRLQYLGWCLFPIVLVTFSTGFVHLCSPTAIGSGIPEMKTILRGVVLNEYLTFRTLISKIVGLTFTLGSGLPLGKEGPSVHIASILATVLSKMLASFQGIYDNESRASEMLSAACAVGVAATFYAPIGGVLFSIEVTTVYFAVRNYWRGFFAACCGATVWRLMGFWFKNDESISALFKTNFRTDYPFDPVELLAFAFIGATSGLIGAAYIKFHREIVQIFRRHEAISRFFTENRFFYPILVTLIITTANFPPFFGKYTASTLDTHTTLEHLFSNRTWSLGDQDLVSKRILEKWTTTTTDFHIHLVLYIVTLFWTSALASTIPIPSGLFIPLLKIGAAYGRFLGELMHSAFPNGINYSDSSPTLIIPGTYAVVGAAALSGAVTHTISSSVIIFEITGQIVHIIPVILGVLVANAVCQCIQPSIYDSIITMKKLPYLPPIASSSSAAHRILVKNFMNTDMGFVWKEKCSFDDVKSLLVGHKKALTFPLVDSPNSMKLLGSVSRNDLLKLFHFHLGRARRLEKVYRKNSETKSPIFDPFFNQVELKGSELSDRESFSQSPDSRIEDFLNSVDHPDRGLELTLDEHQKTSLYPTNLRYAINDQSSLNDPSNGHIDITKKTSKSSRDESNSDTKDLQVPTIIISPANEHQYGTFPDQRGKDSVNSTKIKRQGSVGDKVHSIRDKDLRELMNRDRQNQYPELGETPVTVETSLELGDISKNDSGRGRDNSFVSRHSNFLARTSKEEQLGARVNHESTPTRPQSSLARTRPASSSGAVAPQNSPIIMGGSGRLPRKSILKTSSTSSGLSNLADKKAIMSTTSFGKNLNGTGGQPRESLRDKCIEPCSLTEISPSNETKDMMLREAQANNLHHRRKVRLPQMRVVDMTPEEQIAWEKEQLKAYIDVDKCTIDEAPFQLVEQTSLYRVHTLFSMLGLHHAYVTSFGRLVGTVNLDDIRGAIERVL